MAVGRGLVVASAFLALAVLLASAAFFIAATVRPTAETESPRPAAGASEQTNAAASPDAPVPSVPSPAAEPVFTFAWVSDLHLDAGRLESSKAAFRWIDAQLVPAFVLFTGDDNSMAAAPADSAAPEPVDLRRHRFFKDFLASNLRAPAVVIPGDNWPGGFEQVFGATQRSFQYGGVHFLLLAPDRVHNAPGMEGLSVLDESTMAWIREDLDACTRNPVVVAIHEPIHPPTFLDAGRLRSLLADRPHVIAVLQGHLHTNLHLSADGKAYLTAPALGPAEVPALKQVLVFPDRLLVRTFARGATAAVFAQQGRDRTVEVPQALRAALRRPAGGFTPEDCRAVPPHPLIDDPTLAARKWELLRGLPKFLDGDVRK